MKTNLLISTFILLAGSVLASTTTPRGAVLGAAQKLAAADNYSWTTTITVPEGSRFHPGPTEGKTRKDGLTWVSLHFGGRTTQMVLRGDKGAVKAPDEEWQSLSQLADAGGRQRFLAMMARGFKTPAVQARELISGMKVLALAGGVYSGDLTAEGAKSMLRFGPRRNGGPQISNAKGSVKFWIDDGVLSKYEFTVQGTMNFNGEDHDIQRTTTVEIKDVGKTKINVPEAARKKLS